MGAPWECIAIDVASPFSVTDTDNKYTMVIQDYFSKWVEVFTIPNQETETIAQMLVDNWISRFVIPIELHSD